MFHKSKKINELLIMNNVKVYMNKKIFLLGIFLLLPVAQAETKDESDHPQTGSIWQLVKNGSHNLILRTWTSSLFPIKRCISHLSK